MPCHAARGAAEGVPVRSAHSSVATCRVCKSSSLPVGRSKKQAFVHCLLSADAWRQCRE